MITIKINPDDLAKVQRMLGGIGNAAPKVLSRALNLTLTGVKTDASAEVRTIITAKKSGVDSTMQIIKSTLTDLSGMVSCTGKPVPLIDFSARQTKTGVSVQVKKATPRSVIQGAFIATVRTPEQVAGGSSGHKGVFWRVWHDTKGHKRKIAYAKLPPIYRLPVEQRFGPRIPDILSNAPVMAAVLKKADDRLHKNIEHELNFELSKL